MSKFVITKIQSCMIQGCTNPAEVGAHVYLDNYSNTQYKNVHIIPTCKWHNNYAGNENRGVSPKDLTKQEA